MPSIDKNRRTKRTDKTTGRKREQSKQAQPPNGSHHKPTRNQRTEPNETKRGKRPNPRTKREQGKGEEKTKRTKRETNQKHNTMASSVRRDVASDLRAKSAEEK